MATTRLPLRLRTSVGVVIFGGDITDVGEHRLTEEVGHRALPHRVPLEPVQLPIEPLVFHAAGGEDVGATLVDRRGHLLESLFDLLHR
jgi:hypothetical protein